VQGPLTPDGYPAFEGYKEGVRLGATHWPGPRRDRSSQQTHDRIILTLRSEAGGLIAFETLPGNNGSSGHAVYLPASAAAIGAACQIASQGVG
jgi:hypothetical protein